MLWSSIIWIVSTRSLPCQVLDQIHPSNKILICRVCFVVQYCKITYIHCEKNLIQTSSKQKNKSPTITTSQVTIITFWNI